MRLAVLAVLFGLSGCSVLVPGFDKKPAETPTTTTTEQPTEEKTADWPKPCELYNAGEELPEYDFKITADNIYTATGPTSSATARPTSSASPSGRV